MFTLTFFIVTELIPRYFFYTLILADVLVISAVPSVLVQRSGKPLGALSWLFALFTIPFLGVLAWWTIGRTHLRRQLRKRLKATKKFLALQEGVQAKRVSKAFKSLLPVKISGRYRGSGLFPPTTGNSFTILSDGKEFFEALSKSILGAEHSIWILMYIWQDDETGRHVLSLVRNAAARGVKVRILLDAMGSRPFLRKYKRTLSSSKLEMHAFLPYTVFPFKPTINFRNHRKLIIIDRRKAFTGGMNIGAQYQHEWRDLMIDCRGPIVSQLEEVFLEDWFFASKQSLVPDRVRTDGEREGNCDATLIASGPDNEEAWMHDIFFNAIVAAKERVYLTTPYFIPSRPLEAALRSAAQRGVDVRILIPAQSDVWVTQMAARAFYSSLAAAGVRFFEFRGKVLHKKVMLVDQELSILGSANVDQRSFKLNFEISIAVHSRSHNERLTTCFYEELSQSGEIKGEELKPKHWLPVLLNSIAHLFSPLL
ncbi:MAG: cardiolipin synthase [Deltaproteobacteria bacterium]|nr:cardiolipin synthase [Deltaproteobacteria bacterium]